MPRGDPQHLLPVDNDFGCVFDDRTNTMERFDFHFCVCQIEAIRFWNSHALEYRRSRPAIVSNDGSGVGTNYLLYLGW